MAAQKRVLSSVLTLNCSRIIRHHRRALSLTNFHRAEYDINGEDDFKKKVLEAKKPIVVDFYAVWCGPCKQLGPMLSKIIEKRNDKVDLAKVNIDTHQELAIRYGVTAVPTVILMRDGEMAGSFLGLIPENEIEEFVPKD
jgi:thioredoxin 1